MIAIGCDHGGLELKNIIVEHIKSRGIEVNDLGIYENKSVDYPDIALPVCKTVQEGKAEKAILVCGTGIGMSIAANKLRGIRAAVCTDHFSTKYTRLHNNTNVLCLGARVLGIELVHDMIDLFVSTEFEGGRHQKRVDMLNELDE